MDNTNGTEFAEEQYWRGSVLVLYVLLYLFDKMCLS